MGAQVKAHVIRIGNSRGVRIPKLLLEQAGVVDAVVLEAADGRITIRAAPRPRHGWEERFQEMARLGDDRLLDAEPGSPNSWDEREWEW